MTIRFNALVCAAFCLFAPTCTHASASSSSSGFQQKCQSFKPEAHIYNSTREVLDFVPAGTNLTFPYNDPSCARASQVVAVDLCRIALSIPTSTRSSITFELWLPEQWSGRFLGTGNGGIDGCVKYEDLAYTTQNGFAAFGTNDGHNGTGGLAFYQNPDIVTDFAWRSLHTGVTAGKTLTEHFYAKPHAKSYYLGCSLGGRQGMKAAEMFPHDFDGIVAGSPALDFNHLSGWRASFYPITGAIGSANFITAAMWTEVIHPEVLKQCDGIDSVMDGIIEDPSLCHFDPQQLLCAPNPVNASACLSAAQVKQVQLIFSPLIANGKLIYPAMQPGSEDMAIAKLYAGKPFSYSEDWYRYVVFNNPNWDPATWIPVDAITADQLNPSNIRTWPTNFDAFRAASGKIITYHGGQDNQITSFNSARFWHRLLANTPNHLDPVCSLDDYYRFFRISGMFHCNSGPGAWVLGQGGNAAAAGIAFEPAGNLLAAMVEWVEKGVAPETVEGTKFLNDVVADGVAFTRRHCKFPLRNTFVGGEANDPRSWVCRPVAGGDPQWY